MKSAVLALAALLFAGELLAAGGELPLDLGACLYEARRARSAHELGREREFLEHARGLEGRDEDEAEVLRRLALLAWRYELRDDEARTILREAVEGPEPGQAWLELARLELERERFDAALEAAAQAEAVGEEREVVRRAELHRSLTVVERASAARRSGEPLEPGALRSAREHLARLLDEEPGLLEPSELLLRAGVLLDDAGAIRAGWRSFYRVGSDDSAPNAVADAFGDLERALAASSDEPADPEPRLALVSALRRSHFHEAARLAALAPELEGGREDERAREALAYAAFVADLRARTDEYYRELAFGRGSRRDLDRAVARSMRELHRALVDAGRFPSSANARWEWLEERFGVNAETGHTAGYYDLHMGHVVVDETRLIEQYGEAADFRHVVLDHMVSNGFQSWAWDRGASHGGWAGPATMWQVRPAYADDSINIWRQMHDESLRARFLERMERETALDDARAEKDPVTFLPGLAARMHWRIAHDLLDELTERGHGGRELRQAFIAELDQAVLEYSIFAHEGRHAIDRELGRFDTPTLEYRAKLSQVVFAPRPRLAAVDIVAPSLGDDTPHGQAGVWALEGVVDWMEEHADEIEGLELSRPLLPQLDLLTDDQLRAAFRSQDPLAR